MPPTPPPTYVRSWEWINKTLKRMKVPDGWLVATTTITGRAVAIAFYPDKNYEWTLGPELPPGME